MKIILVRGLSPSVTQSDLLRLFEEHGSVVGVDMAEGQDFGFVRMVDHEQARKAIDVLNGTSCCGATLSICAAGKNRLRGPGSIPATAVREVLND